MVKHCSAFFKLSSRFFQQAHLRDRPHQGSVRDLDLCHAHSAIISRECLDNSSKRQGQCDRGASSFFDRIKSPSFKLHCYFFHFERIIIAISYQQAPGPFSTSCGYYFHILQTDRVLSDARPIRKWYGVSASLSLMSSLTPVGARLFTITSASTRTVWSVSSGRS